MAASIAFPGGALGGFQGPGMASDDAGAHSRVADAASKDAGSTSQGSIGPPTEASAVQDPRALWIQPGLHPARRGGALLLNRPTWPLDAESSSPAS